MVNNPMVLLIILIFYGVLYQVHKRIYKKFGEKIINKIYKYILPAIFVISFISLPFISIFFDLGFSDQDGIFSYILNVLLASVIVTIAYIFLIALPLHLIITAVNIFSNAKKFISSFAELLNNPIKSPTEHEIWIWTISKLISLVLTPTLIFSFFYLITWIFTSFVQPSDLSELIRSVSVGVDRLINLLLPFSYIILFVVLIWSIYALFYAIIGIFGLISRMIFYLLK